MWTCHGNGPANAVSRDAELSDYDTPTTAMTPVKKIK